VLLHLTLDSAHLGAVRIAFYSWLYWSLRWNRVKRLVAVQRRYPVLWQPHSAFRLIGSSAVGAIVVAAIALWPFAIFCAATGLAHPLGNITVTALFLMLMGYDQQFGKVHRAWNVVPITSAILSAARSDAFCVAPLFNEGHLFLDNESTIVCVRVLLACVWGSAGLSKLLHGGLRWVRSEQLWWLIRLHLTDCCFVRPAMPGLSRWFLSHPAVCRLAAATVVSCELLYPLSLLSSKAAVPLVIGSLFGIVGFRLALGPGFWPLAATSIVFWFPFVAVSDVCGYFGAMFIMVMVLIGLQLMCDALDRPSKMTSADPRYDVIVVHGAPLSDSGARV